MSRHRACAGAALDALARTLVPFGHALLVFGFLLPCACQSKPPDRLAPLAAASPPRPASPPPDQPGNGGPAQRFTFSAEVAPAFVPTKDLLDLEDGVRMSRQEFEARAVRAHSPQALEACRAGSLLVVLDDQSPRPLLQPSVPLRSLVDEDRELSPGWHVLSAFVRSPERTTLQVARFQLETDLPASPSDSQCALLEPAGTVVLPAGGALRLLAAPLGAQVEQFEYHVDGEPGATFRAQTLEAVRVLGLPLGDHRLGVRCYDGTGALVGESERTVTVNLGEEVGTP